MHTIVISDVPTDEDSMRTMLSDQLSHLLSLEGVTDLAAKYDF